MTAPNEPHPSVFLVRAAVVCALVGLSCLSVFLWLDFSPWSLGVGIAVGTPFTAVALALYVLAVLQELRRRGEL